MKLNDIKLKKLMKLLLVLSLSMLMVVQAFYYCSFFFLSKERAKSVSADLVGQVSSQLRAYAQNIQSGAEKIAFSKHIQEYLTTEDMHRKNVELNPFVQEYLEFVKSSNLNIRNVLLTDRRGGISTSAEMYEFNILSELKKQGVFSNSVVRAPFFTGALQSDNTWYQAYVFPVLSASNRTELFERIGYCIILSKMEVLERLVLNVTLAPNSHFLITDGQGRIVASNDQADIGQLYEGFRDKAEGKRDDIVQQQAIKEAGLTIYSELSTKDLVSDMTPILQWGLLIGFAAAGILLVISLLFSRVVTSSVAVLVDFLKSVDSLGNIRARIPIHAKNEIGLISRNINAMLDQIDHMTHEIVTTQAKLYDAEIGQKQIELSMLQSQINPHFLYNTLNCISSIALVYDAHEIVTITYAMAQIFRYSIKGPKTVRVEQELACVKDYLSIMDVRYQGKFSTSLKIAPELMEAVIPKMILQPLVENAFYHGLERRQASSLLMIEGERINGEMVFSISDDGKGMSGEELDVLRLALELPARTAGSGVGLFNINDRIKLLYGDAFGLSVDSRENEGTCVRITLPFSRV